MEILFNGLKIVLMIIAFFSGIALFFYGSMFFIKSDYVSVIFCIIACAVCFGFFEWAMDLE